MNFRIYGNSLLVGICTLCLIMTGCKEEDPMVDITFTPVLEDVDGDIVGQGGTHTRSYSWENALARAELNMDITASSGGSLNIIVKDADGVEVISSTLTVGVGDDSKTVCSAAGTAGVWKVTVKATNFSGDASFSLSQGC